jgi:hypothetical protein
MPRSKGNPAPVMDNKMTVASIKDNDIEAAALIDDIDVAVKSQDIAGITTGDVAGICFSGFDWASQSTDARVHQIHAWLKSEAAYEHD